MIAEQQAQQQAALDARDALTNYYRNLSDPFNQCGHLPIFAAEGGTIESKRGLVDGPCGYAGERNTGLSGLLGSTMLAEDIPEKNSNWISRVSPTKEIDMIKRIYEEKGNEGLQAYLERNPDLNDKYVIVESSAIDGGELTVMPNKLHPDNMEGTVIMMGDGKGGTMEIDMSTMSEENKANGGRIGMWSGGGIKGLWNLGKGMLKGGDDAVDLVKHELLHAIFYVRQLDGANEENIVNGMATHYTEIEKNNPDYVRWKLQNLN